jgi:hypothetical protein
LSKDGLNQKLFLNHLKKGSISVPLGLQIKCRKALILLKYQGFFLAVAEPFPDLVRINPNAVSLSAKRFMNIFGFSGQTTSRDLLGIDMALSAACPNEHP